MGILGEPDAELRIFSARSTAFRWRPVARSGRGSGGEIYTAVRARLPARRFETGTSSRTEWGWSAHEAPRLTATGPVSYPDSDAALPLQAGMVLLMETTLAHERRGFIKLEDTVAVTGMEPKATAMADAAGTGAAGGPSPAVAGRRRSAGPLNSRSDNALRLEIDSACVCDQIPSEARQEVGGSGSRTVVS